MREVRSLFTLVRPRFLFWYWLASLIPDQAMPSIRARLYRLAGCDIERGVAILGKVLFIGAGDFPARLHIRAGAIIGLGVTVGLDEHITIGNNVSISPFSTLYTGTHQLGFGSRRMDYAVTPKPISIEDGAWVGMNCVVLPGVTIGRGAVVSAGSIVKANIAANTLAEGNPALVINKLPFGNR